MGRAAQMIGWLCWVTCQWTSRYMLRHKHGKGLVIGPRCRSVTWEWNGFWVISEPFCRSRIGEPPLWHFVDAEQSILYSALGIGLGAQGWGLVGIALVRVTRIGLMSKPPDLWPLKWSFSLRVHVLDMDKWCSVARIVPCSDPRSDPRPSPTVWSQFADHCGDAVLWLWLWRGLAPSWDMRCYNWDGPCRVKRRVRIDCDNNIS